MSITVVIIILTCLVSYRAFSDQSLFYNLAHWPMREFHRKEYYRLVTSGFVHGSWWHLLVNMFVLYSFGEIVEYHYKMFFGPVMGGILYVLVYLLVIVCASIPSFFQKKDFESYTAIGASGGVSGIVFIFILMYPWEMLLLYAIIPIPGIVAGILYLWYSSYASKNVDDHIDHQAHFYGALFGLVFTLFLRPSLAGDFLHGLVHDIPNFSQLFG
jgi:membrane associated rhomboid family serine protease